MTDLKKRLSVSVFALFALAFCCLIISQAAIARSDRVVKVGSADNVITDRVPLPIVDVRGGQSGAGLSTFDPAEGRLAEVQVRQPFDFAGLGKPLALRPEDDVKASGAFAGGGEDPATATVIASLPYTDAGTLTGTTADDYPLDCGFGDPGDGDLFYKYTATYDVWIDISMCNTDNPYKDFVVGLWEGDPSDGGTMVACDEDACVAPDWGSPHLQSYQLTTGTDYYIQIKGWGIGDGNYVLDVVDPFSAALAAATYVEAEACGDNTNGGCSYGGAEAGWDDAEFVDGCGETLYGTTRKTAGGTGYPTYRDGDQWRFEITTVNKLAVTFQTEQNMAFFMHYYTTAEDCASQLSMGGFAIPAGEVFENEYVLYPGWYTISVRSNLGADDEMYCGEGPAGDPRYYILTECVELTPVDDCGLAREISGDTEPGVPIVQDLCGFAADGPNVCPYEPYGAIPYLANGWFLWECEETGVYTFSACTSPNVAGEDPVESHDLMMAVFPEGCPPDYCSELGFSDDGDACPGWEPEVTDVICAEGLYYLITVAAWDPWSGQDCGEVWLEISHAELPLLGNSCATDRLTIDEETWGRFFHNLNATLDGPAESICNANEFGGDIWYEITAWQSGWMFALFCDVNFDENNELYAGTTCPTNANPIPPLRCADDACPDMSDFNGGYVDVPVTTGDKFLLRVGGWYRLPDYPLAAYGMGYGYFDCFITDQWDTLPVPVNDECKDVTPIALVDGVVDTRILNQDWMRKDTCHLLHPKWSESEIWEAFTVPAGICMHVAIDYFGYTDACDNSSRSRIEPAKGFVWTGCPCEGDYFAILADRGCLNNNNCAPGIPGGDFNNFMEFLMLPSGDYFFPHNHWTIGGNCGWGPGLVNFTGTVIECTYCEGAANEGTCTWPQVAGASWIINVNLGPAGEDGIHKVGTPTNVPLQQSDCNSYEDWTVEPDRLVAHLYRGIGYTVQFTMGKVGVAGQYDVAGVYIDWNENSVWFDPGETYIPTRLALTWTAPVTVPLYALDPGVGGSGEIRMRVRLGSTSDAGQPAACGNVVWGEVEDFVIEVMDIECGDFDGDDDVDADDVAFIRAYYFGGAAPDYWQRADIDGDGYITIADVIALADAAYRGGPLVCL